MKFRSLVATTAITAGLSAFSALPSQAEEFEVKRLFVVGDSLSDAGTFSQRARGLIAGATGAQIEQVPNINYKFLTNAPDGSSRVWSEVVAERLGLTQGPDVKAAVFAVDQMGTPVIDPMTGLPIVVAPAIEENGGNYAQGGARVTSTDGVGFADALPVVGQITALEQDVMRFEETDLIAVWAGANDVFAQATAFSAVFVPGVTPDQIQQARADAISNIEQAARELSDQIQRLKDLGATNVIVVSLPDIGTTPSGLDQADGGVLFTDLSNAFNAQLKTSLNGKNAVIVDAGKLLNAVSADPVRYGFTAMAAATQEACPGQSIVCLQGVPGGASADSEQRIYADGVHPTSAAHALFGQAGFAGLQAATQAGTMPVAILTAIRQQAISLENRLNPTAFVTHDEDGKAKRRTQGDWEFYGGAEVGYYKSEEAQVRPGLKALTEVLRAGADVMVTDNALIGAAASIDHGQLEFDGDRGGFDSRLFIGGIFGMVSLPRGAYFNAALGGGLIDVYEVERKFMLGPAQESYEADTDGYYTMARIGGGVMVPVTPDRRFLINPSASITHEEVKIEGYTESDGAASLSFGDLSYKTQRVSVALTGIFSNPEPGGISATLRVSLEHDLLKDDLEVDMGPDTDTLATVRAPRPDRTFGFIQGQVSKQIGIGALTLAGSAVVGADSLTGITGSLSYRAKF